MKPWETIDSARSRDGSLLELARRADEWVVRVAGRTLMTSRTYGSEQALASLALESAARQQTVLVGGLGLGFTLRAALDRVPASGKVVVVELVRELCAWNRGPVGHLAGRPLDDPRTELRVGDVVDHIARSRQAFDAILLDVDNGPGALIHAANGRLYDEAGVRSCRRALRPGGVLAVWSTGPDPSYVRRLARAGLEAEQRRVPARAEPKGTRHVIFLGRRARAGERER
jgi:spermidine synthase